MKSFEKKKASKVTFKNHRKHKESHKDEENKLSIIKTKTK